MSESILNLFKLPDDPFTNEFMKKELEFYGVHEKVKVGNATIQQHTTRGRCDDYLNRNFRISDMLIPALLNKQGLWMSMTWMEVQSQFVPIWVSEGEVAILGLGMGYAALRMAAKKEVESVTVYEIDPDIIALNQKLFSGRECWKKVILKEGDARQIFTTDLENGAYYNMVYSDIYQTLLPDECLEDLERWGAEEGVEAYYFWGSEKIWLDIVTLQEDWFREHLSDCMPWSIRAYLKQWLDTPYRIIDDVSPSNLYNPIVTDMAFISRFTNATKRIHDARKL